MAVDGSPPNPVGTRDPLEVFDESDAMDRLGDEDLLLEVLNIFLDDAPQTFRSLQTAVAAKDWGTAARHAHSLKGSAANISAPGLRRAAAECEDEAKSGAPGDIAKRVDLLESELKQLIVLLEKRARN